MTPRHFKDVFVSISRRKNSWVELHVQKAVLCLTTVLQYYRHCKTIFDWENGGKFYLILSRALCSFRHKKAVPGVEGLVRVVFCGAIDVQVIVPCLTGLTTTSRPCPGRDGELDVVSAEEGRRPDLHLLHTDKLVFVVRWPDDIVVESRL